MDYSTLALGLVKKYNITDATMTDIEKIAQTIERIGLEKTEKLLSIGNGGEKKKSVEYHTLPPVFGMDYTFKSPKINGELTKYARIFLDVYAYSKLGYAFTKEELLKRVNVGNRYNKKVGSGTCSNLFCSAVRNGLLKREKGKVYCGKNLEEYLKAYRLID